MTTLITAGGQLLRTNYTGAPRPWAIQPGAKSVELTDGQTLPYDKIYASSPAVAAVVNKLCRQIATLPLKAYSTNSQNETVEAPTHDVARLIRRPVERRGAVDFKQWIALPALIHGNALLAKYRGNGPDRPPTEVLPLDWRYLSAYAQIGGPIEWWATTQTGASRWISVDETAHFGWDSPVGQLGTSPLEQLAAPIKLEDAARRHQVSSFANSARPSGALVIPPDREMTPDDRRELREEIRLLHGGVDNSFRVALLSGGLDWKPMEFSSQEAELITARVFNREEVAMVYDVPPPLIGDLRRGTYSNVTELHRMLYVTVLRPWLAMIEERFSAEFIEPEAEWAGVSVKFDLSEVLRGSRAEEVSSVVQAVSNGLLTPNEGRQQLGLNKVANPVADELHVQANNVQPLGSVPQPELRPPAPFEAPGP